MGGAVSSSVKKTKEAAPPQKDGSETKANGSASDKAPPPRVFHASNRMSSRFNTHPGTVPDNVRVFFILGPPGSGKTTQCKQLSGTLGYSHINLADVLREEIQQGTTMGQQISILMAAGETVPNEMSIAILKASIITAPHPIVLLDGFPRSLDQVDLFQRTVVHCTGVLFLTVPSDVAMKRLLKEGSGDAGVVRRLHKAYLEQIDPIVRYFTDRMKCQEINGTNPVDLVARDFSSAVQQYLNFIDDDIKSVSDFDEDSDEDDDNQQADQSIGTSTRSSIRDLKPINRMVSEAPWIAGELPDDMRIIFILGPPGSGKSTQCQRMQDRYGCAHLYVGDLLRAEVKSGTALGRMAEEFMSNGQLVPLHISLTLLKRAMLQADTDLVLVDGFPRSLDQVKTFEKQVAPCSGVLFFEIPQDIAVRRVLKRGETSGRVDDNVSALNKQFETFMTQAMPVRDHYLKLEKCQIISGEPPPDAVFEAVASALKGFGESLKSESRYGR